MDQPASNISEIAFRAFVRTSGLLRNKMAPYFARFGISAAQWGVLRALQRAEGEGFKGLQFNDLGRRLLVKPPSVTSIVDRLERLGLVTREAAVADLRAKRVRLTAQGRTLLRRVLRRHPAQIREVMAGLNQTEQRELGRLMERLAAHLESLGAQDTANLEASPHTVKESTR
jgi:DNA-binding MarR family transcriptional regulator